jgi:hypothetical protein
MVATGYVQATLHVTLQAMQLALLPPLTPQTKDYVTNARYPQLVAQLQVMLVATVQENGIVKMGQALNEEEPRLLVAALLPVQ